MKSTPLALLVVTCTVLLVATPEAAQRGALREMARTNGKVDRFMMCCGPTLGLKEIVEHTQLTVEGSVARVETGLHEAERDEYVYTDYFVDVTRTFRAPAYVGGRTARGEAVPWPFVPGAAVSRSKATALAVKLRVPHQGSVRVDGGTITDSRNFPTLKVGQHVVLSAYYCRDVDAWVPLGVFEVRDGRVVRVQENLERDYASIAEFATALANPPPTVR